jgi:uncharacterized RDD family membrane protein YckC
VSTIAPGWYKDPADPTTQRYWDGDGWIGEAIPAGATPPAKPPSARPVVKAPAAASAAHPATPPAPARPATAPAPPRVQLPAPAPPGALPAPPGWPYGYPYPGVPRPHGLALAGVGSRIVARMVDIMAVLALCALANAWFAYRWWQIFLSFLHDFTAYEQHGGQAPQPPSEFSTLTLMMCVVATAVWFAYEVPGSANSGQTLGKRLLGIKVMRLENDQRLGFGRAWRRWSRLGLPTLLWSFCGVGFVLQFFDCAFAALDRPLHQALHDKTAATVVVHVARPQRQHHTSTRGGSRADPH